MASQLNVSRIVSRVMTKSTRVQSVIFWLGMISWAEFAVFLSAAEIEWNGAVSSQFQEPGNWAGGVVPSANDTATIVRTASPYHDLIVGRDERIVLKGLQIGQIGKGQGLNEVVLNGGDLDAGQFRMQWGDGVQATYTQFGGRLWMDELVLDGGRQGMATFQVQAGDVWLGAGGIRMTASHPNAQGEIFLSSSSKLDARDAGASLFGEVNGRLRLQLDDGSTIQVAGNVSDVSQLSDVVEFSPRRIAPCDSTIRDFYFDYDAAADSTYITTGPTERLFPGDADMDFDFDQVDLVQVQIAGKYLTDQSATWGEGDWNGGPGGTRGNPPPGDGLFNQLDIVAALQAYSYVTCGVNALVSNDSDSAGPGSNGHDPATGDVAMSAGTIASSSIHRASTRGTLASAAAEDLVGGVDVDSDTRILETAFGLSIGSAAFENIAERQLSEGFLTGNLALTGALVGGDELAVVETVFVPEPPTAVLLAMAAFVVAFVAAEYPEPPIFCRHSDRHRNRQM